MPPRVAFHTLGCKLNQLETESIAEAFARAGLAVTALGSEEGEGIAEASPPSFPDMVVINTCTVTGKAEQKARRIIRLALASNPRAVVLVTGCYAQVEAGAIARLGERLIVVPGSAKDKLLGLPNFIAGIGESDDLLDELRDWLIADQGIMANVSPHGMGPFAYSPGSLIFHSRPSLKIQDGCDKDCAYCRVHIARGNSVSLPAREVLARARALEEAERAEIVLSGVNISQYRDGDMDFPDLLKYLLDGTERIAFRVSSYEPDRVDESFLEAFADPRVRPHAHIALQSGADSILSSMGRGYNRKQSLAAIHALRRVKGDPFLAADIIVGFPGESEADAAATIELAAECDFAWIHAFRFSPRPGTRAASFRERVPERVAGERVLALLELGRAGKTGYVERWRGRELRAVLESDGRVTSENYLKLRLRDVPQRAVRGQELVCRIEERAASGTDPDIDAFALYISP